MNGEMGRIGIFFYPIYSNESSLSEGAFQPVVETSQVT